MTDKRIPWLGIALIILGGALLVDQLDVVNITFSDIFWPLMMLLGLVSVWRGFTSGKRGKIFSGTLLFLFSVFFFVRSLDYYDFHGFMVIPGAFLIFGLAFLMLFINNFRDWTYLIPAVLLLGVGVAFILSELGYLYYWDVWDAVRTYWPLILVAAGLGIILRRRGPGVSGPNQAVS